MLKRAARTAVYALANRLLSRFDPAAPLVLRFQSLPDGEVFASWLRALAGDGRPVVPLAAVADWVRGGDGPPEGAVALTLDGCFASQLERAAPALERLRWPATFFAPSDHLGGSAEGWKDPASTSAETRLIGRREVRSLVDRGFDLGSLSATHRYLPYLRPEDLREELHRAKAELEEIAGRPIEAFAYPYGRFDPETVRAVEEAGFTRAATQIPGPVRREDSPFLLPRVSIPERALDPRLFLAHVRGAAKPLNRLLRYVPLR